MNHNDHKLRRQWALAATLSVMSFGGCAGPLRPSSTEVGGYSAKSPVEIQSRSSVVATPANYPGIDAQPTDVFKTPASTMLPRTQAVYGDDPLQVPSDNNAPTDVLSSGRAARSGIVLASYTPDSEEPSGDAGVVRLTSASSGHHRSASTFRAAEPRIPVYQPGCPDPSLSMVSLSQLAEAYPDEYIYDGGDRDTPVHYFGGLMAGLETEDTVAEFRDHTGENHVKASNRVAIYAPRFGSVETVSGPGIDIKVDRAVGAVDVAGPGGIHDNIGLEARTANTLASGVESRRSASGAQVVQEANASAGTQAVVLNSKVDQGMQARSINGLNILERTSVQEITIQIREPVTSANRTGFGISAATSQATAAYATFRAQATVGIEEGRHRKGEIYLTKEATPLIAKPGDVITFTIRFTNIGDLNVQDVRIVDNLTPRLRYLEGSGGVELRNGSGGSLTVIPNAEGSEILEFLLDEPLKGGDFGVITFQARVK